jgi:hypothetical protein
VQKLADGGIRIYNWDRVFHRFRPYSTREGSNQIWITQGYIWYKGDRFTVKGVSNPDNPLETFVLSLPTAMFGGKPYAYAIAILDVDDTNHEFTVELRDSISTLDIETERLLFVASLVTEGTDASAIVVAQDFQRHQLSDIVITEDGGDVETWWFKFNATSEVEAENENDPAGSYLVSETEPAGLFTLESGAIWVSSLYKDEDTGAHVLKNKQRCLPLGYTGA